MKKEDKKFYIIICIGFYFISMFFCARVFFGLGRVKQLNTPCTIAQCMSERIKGEESCYKWRNGR